VKVTPRDRSFWIVFFILEVPCIAFVWANARELQWHEIAGVILFGPFGIAFGFAMVVVPLFIIAKVIVFLLGPLFGEKNDRDSLEAENNDMRMLLRGLRASVAMPSEIQRRIDDTLRRHLK
jgi:uncharacterized membrane protein